MKQQSARFQCILSMVIFGTISIFVKGIPLPSSVTAMFRGFCGTIFLILVAKFSGHKLDFSGIRGNGLILPLSGALLGFNWIFFFESFRYTTVATATLCYYMAPVLVILTSPIFLKERLTRGKLFCVAVAFLGMIFVSGVAESGLPKLSESRGILFALGAACMYAGIMILNQKIHDVAAYERTAAQLLTAGVVLIPYCALTAEIPAGVFTAKVICLLLIVGIVHTGITYLLYFGSMEFLSGQTVSMLSYLDPIVAVLVSVFILREGFSLYTMIGAVLVLGAAIASELLPSGKTEEA